MNDEPGEADASDWLQAQFDDPDQAMEPEGLRGGPPELVEPDVNAPDTLGGILGVSEGVRDGVPVATGFPDADRPALPSPAPRRPAPASPVAEPFRWGLTAGPSSDGSGDGAESPAAASPGLAVGSNPQPAEADEPDQEPDWASGPRTARQTFRAPALDTQLLTAGPQDQPFTEAAPTVSFLAGLHPTEPLLAGLRPAGLTGGAPAAQPPTELLPAGVRPRGSDDSSLAALLASKRFQDDLAASTSDAVPLAAARAALPPVAPEPEARPAGPRISRRQRMLLWTALGVIAALALVALFYVGTRLPEFFGTSAAASPATAPSAIASPSPSPTPTPTPSATAVPAAAGPLPPGTYRWEQLAGGECLSPYRSPWAERFTVVDCATPHPAQLVHRGVLEAATGSAYPGADALQAQVGPLCSAPTVINFAAAGAFHDLQLAASFPADQRQWASGNRGYYCFVTRKSGEPLTGSVAVPVG